MEQYALVLSLFVGGQVETFGLDSFRERADCATIEEAPAPLVASIYPEIRLQLRLADATAEAPVASWAVACIAERPA